MFVVMFQEETPRLSDDTLQRLLAEARESCLSESRLSDLTPVSSLDTQQMTARSEDSNPACKYLRVNTLFTRM